MVARIKPDGSLIVVFARDGAEPEEHPAADARAAAAVAIRILVKHLTFLPGDILLCRRADILDQDLPQASRASHMS